MACRADKMRQHRSANKCRMRLMICRPKKKCFITQIHLINRKPDIIGRDFIHGYCPFSLINAAALSDGEVSNGYPVSYRQLSVLNASCYLPRVNFPRTFRLISNPRCQHRAFSSGEAKAIWLSPVPANLPPKRDSYWWQRGTWRSDQSACLKGQVLNPFRIGINHLALAV